VELSPGLRREPPTDLASVGQDEDLVARIRAEIRRDGPITFARFMELALYDPDGGYYRGADAKPGRGGDFVTAPELHPIFGQTLSTGLQQIWAHLGRPGRFVVREHGAGTGALAVAVLGAIVDPDFRDAVRYQPVEVDPRRVTAFVDRLAAAGLDDLIETGSDDVAEDDQRFVGVVLANEVLDALPVHRVRRRGDRLMELMVAVGEDDELRETELPPTTPEPAQRLRDEGIELRDGQTAEVCLALDAWVAAAAGPLRRGMLLLIDYGYPAAELYDPIRRTDGTLRSYVRHQVHDDPYRHIGRQDLTTHVDVTAVERAAHRAGLDTIGLTTQAEALMGLGIQDRLQAIQADPTTSLEDYLAVRSALMRLLDPAAMGRFRVMAFGRDWPLAASDANGPGDPALGLFSYRLPRRS
jgi:SAM-dependent MidA family methyltransferase